MTIILGLAAAIFWGAADFLARYSTRIIGTYRTLFFMQFFGLIILSIYLAFAGDFGRLCQVAFWQAWVWALLAALLNVVSSLALYRAFEVGILTIVSPIAASSAALSVVFALMSGETISRPHGVGIMAALFGVALAATAFSSTKEVQDVKITEGASRHTGILPRGVAWALAASLGYGIIFWILGFRVTPVLGGIAPVWLIRLTTLSTLSLLVVPLKQKVSVPRGSVWWFIAGAGLLDTAAYVSFTIGLTAGQVAIIGVIASLFSAVTVLLAWIFIREKLQWSQWLGVAIIFVAIVLVNV
ncbi:MAG TPA: DMT family transporter [Ktedonobacteraceae bacterium]|nr:DMT family transporter [Ktedonobacteraceae bacterium]